MTTTAAKHPGKGTVGYFYFSQLPSRGAHSIQVLSMCDAIEAIGWRTTLFASRNVDQPTAREDEILAEYGVENRPAFHWVRWERLQWRRRARTFLTTLWWARRFEVCFTRNSLSALACELMRKTCYYELHSAHFPKMDRAVLRALRHSRWVRLVANSAMTAHMVSDDLGLDRSRFRVAHNGCKIATIGTDSVPLGSDLLSHFVGPAPRAVYVGSFYPGRGIETIAELARRHVDVQFVAIGDTADRAGLPHPHTEVPNLHIFARIAHNLAGEVLQRGDILLMPYGKRVTAAGEGDYLKFCSPIKMFEYLAAGKAIVSTGSPSIEEILRDGENAIIVEAENIDEWSSAIERLKHDPRLRAFLGKNALATALEHTWEGRARALLSEVEAKNEHC